MEKSVFLKEVKAELDNIKSRATETEIARLNFEAFEHDSRTACIYGQLTGNCDSQRANELQEKTYDRVQAEGECVSPTYNPFKKQDFSKGNSYTALEKYLFMVKPVTHGRLIQYLKGEIKSITLR